MEKQMHDIKKEIEKAIEIMFPLGEGPLGEGRTTRPQAEHWLNIIAQIAFREGKAYGGLTNILTAQDVAERFNISGRRARALMENRHSRFGIGSKIGNQWLIHIDELPAIAPDAKYRGK